MRGISYLRSQERWVFWAGFIATYEHAMITAPDALVTGYVYQKDLRLRLPY